MAKLLASQNLHWIIIGLAALFLIYNLFLLFRFIYLRRHPDAGISRWFSGQLYTRWKIIETVLILLVFIPIAVNFILLPKVISPTDPAMGTTEVSDSRPIEVVFDRPINKGAIQFEVTPNLPGAWQIDRGVINGRGRAIFTPAESPLLESRYTVSISGIKNIWGNTSNKYLFSFQTLPLPGVKEISIADGDEGVSPNQTIDFTLDHFPDKSVQIDFESSPALELIATKEGDIYHVKSKDDYQKGINYNLKVYRTPLVYNYAKGTSTPVGEKTEIKSLNFKIIEAPSVKSTSPSGSGVLTDTNISIEYKQDMDRKSVESYFVIYPGIQGVFSWEGSRKVIFKPDQNLAKNTTYQVTVSKSAMTAGGETLTEDATFSFTTIGYVTVSKFVPANGASGVATNASISIGYNQAVDHGSAESKFGIAPSVTGSFSWSDNTMIFSHGELSSNTKYTVTIGSGVKSIAGLDSKDIFSASFTTKIPTTTINVPSYRQAHMYSCMATAARNALAFKGVSVTESAVLSRIGYDTTAWSGTWAEGGAVWGDPEAGIVGNVDGKANNIGWGYGSHWTPVANAINSLGRTAEIKSGWSVTGIAAEIAAGNPVIVWWVNGVWPAYEVNWKTPGGKSIRGVNSMHVQVVKGFTGTVDNPLSFTVTDSGYGYPSQTFDVGTFKAKWSWFGNVAVVVR